MIPEIDPVVARQHLCSAIIGYRKGADLSQNEVAASLDWSWSKVNRIEAGLVGLSTTDLAALLRLYGIDDPPRVAELTDLARASRRKPWWYEYRDLVSPDFGRLLGYERGAAWLWAFQPQLVPGLLQTREYASALFGDTADPEKRERLISLRLRRQEILRGPGRIAATLLVGEAALHNRVVSAPQMAAQLRQLRQLAMDGPIDLGVIPFSDGIYPAMVAGFTLIGLRDGRTAVFQESAHRSRTALDDRELTDGYVMRFSRIQERALVGEKAAAVIDGALSVLGS